MKPTDPVSHYLTDPGALFPFRVHRLSADEVVAVSSSGDHAFLSNADLHALINDRSRLPLATLLELKGKFFLGKDLAGSGLTRLLASRLAARKETVLSGPALHIIVPTLQCEHSCQYCQVSRSLETDGVSMSMEQLQSACDSILESPSPTLTIEFQGGDPLLRFDLVKEGILRITERNQAERRRIRFVVASTLHQLTPEMCVFLRQHGVFLSTSLDGPKDLHNSARKLPSQDSYERTLAGVRIAREHVGATSVSAVMTTTRASLPFPEDIVDEYVAQGFNEIFVRPLSPYGFAKRSADRIGYTLLEFQSFYQRTLERVLHWNRNGVAIREVTASVILNKLLCSFDAGYVDLQSPNGAALATLVYNYDGFVYPSDEARMLAETGDTSLRLGRIGERLALLVQAPAAKAILKASTVEDVPGCKDCAFNLFCAADPVQAQGLFGTMHVPVRETEHCQRQTWLFEFFLRWLKRADQWSTNLAFSWAKPVASEVRA